MGTEFGQEAEWADGRSLDWWLLDHPDALPGARAWSRTSTGSTDHPALWELDYEPAGFRWIDADDAGRNTYSFLRSERRPGDGRAGTRGGHQLQRSDARAVPPRPAAPRRLAGRPRHRGLPARCGELGRVGAVPRTGCDGTSSRPRSVTVPTVPDRVGRPGT